MSLKDLFSNLNASIVTSGSLNRIAEEVESTDYLQSYLKQQNKLRAHIDFSKPENFAKFGSAEKYYSDSIERIYNTYPYDGSLYEKVQFELSSSDIDKFIFENDYPRTNGYVIFSGDGWTTQSSIADGYGVPSTKQYIFIKGGPNTSNRLEGKGIDDSSGNYRSGFSNYYDLAKDRDSNLRIDGVEGNTVEFFLKKDQFITSLTEKEVVFDAFTTLYESGDVGYGRLRITLTGSDGVPFLVTYQSGTAGFEDQLLGQNITTASVADSNWHHYAITFKNNGNQVQTQLYIDGTCNHTTNLGTSINYVSGNFNATIGALGASTGSSGPILGAGKFSGSIDEFRFWKTQRSSLQVGRYMREQVGGGTNTDDANGTLGAYYKFNEGITQTASIDKTMLDYSGRISNGTFVGYDTTVRNVGSAFVSSSLATFEFKDPILYSFHPEVVTLQNNKEAIGREYDYTNPNSIYNSIPAWVTEIDNIKNEPPLKNLTQIISNYFDTLYNQIENLSKLRHINYVSGTADVDDKPYFFNDRVLQGAGFPHVPDLFSDATFFEYFKNRTDDQLFEKKLYDVKNTIYRNIYNNLVYINKTKGTEKAFRNTLRCFGVDDEIYKIRYYATDAVHEYRDNYKSIVENKNYVNFALTGTSEATVYQYQTDSNTTSFISSSADILSGGFGFTVEAQAIFPIVEDAADISTTITSKNRATVSTVRDFVEDLQTSIYGVRTADASLGENDLTIPTNDRSGFVVKAIRDGGLTSRAYFELSPTDATSYIPTITSAYFEDVFDNTRWNFAVSVKPTRYGQFNHISGSSDDTTYDVVFQGVNSTLDEIRDSFELTTTISTTNGQIILNQPKRVFAGALRENLSGSLTTRSNAFITDCRFWLAPLSFVDVKKHNIDFENYGIESPYQSAYLFQNDGVNIRIPNIETLALNWNFYSLTSSNASGQFDVIDVSSGSANDNRFGSLSSVLSRQHSARGDHFLISNTRCFTKKDVYNAKTQLPEYINSSDMIRISNQDDVTFTRSTKPTEFVLSIEKSMYQTVSEEMIQIFSTIADYGSIVGNLVNRYRFENKDLSKLRQMFFERVSNTPKLERYLDYYRWLDTSLNVLLANLVPATAITFDSETLVQSMVEEYIFNKNRYTSKFPTLEFKQSDPEGALKGVNELLYDWEFGHAPFAANFANLKSIAFNGTTGDSQLTVDETTADGSLSFGDGSDDSPFSFSFWVKLTDMSTGQYLISKQTSGGGVAKEYYLFVASSGAFYAYLLDGSTSNYIRKVSAASSVSVGNWTHICVTYNGDGAASDIKIYVDGTEDSGTTGTGGSYTAMDNTVANLAIMRRYSNATTNVVNGLIDELAVFDKELSSVEVSELWNSDRILDLNTFSAAGSLISWWRMGDKATGTSPNYTIPDQIGDNDAEMSDFQGDSTSGVVSDVVQNPADVVRDDNCLWWNERATRITAGISSGDSSVDADRDTILTVLNNQNNASAPNLSGSDGSYQGSTYALRKFARPYKLTVEKQKDLHGGSNTSENKKVGFWDAIRRRPTPDGENEGALITIQPSESTLEDFKDCDDNSTLRLGKRKYSFSVQTSTDGAAISSTVNKFKGGLVFPFSLYSSSVNNGAMGDVLDFQDNLNVTNLHQDSYGPFNEVPMQGPFTDKYVGGRAYRHVFTNFTFDNEYPGFQGERLEGWMLSGTSDGLFLKNPSHPKSVYFRDGLAKRPVNIANIQQLTGAVETEDEFINPLDVTVIGNYTKGYEMVMTNGRSINNRYLVEAGGDYPFTESVGSTVVSGVFDFALPRRDLTGSNSYIIVNRFSAPGDPATMGEGMLDVASAEYSVYNALPWRNLSVRQPLDQLYSDHTNQFGYFSDAFTVAAYDIADETYPGGSSSVNALNYSGTGSFHKVNRNGRLSIAFSGSASYEDDSYITTTRYDNWFIQRQIPQTDLQYAWITASVINDYTGAAAYWFEQPDWRNAGFASTDLTFVSASDAGSGLDSSNRWWGTTKDKVAAFGTWSKFIPTDFVGLNTNIYEPITSSENFLGYPKFVAGPTGPSFQYDYLYQGGLIYSLTAFPSYFGVATVLNGILLHRHGPYGGANWKLYRKDNHPIVRAHRKENRLSFLKVTQYYESDEGLAKHRIDIASVIEPPVNSKFRPIAFDLSIKVNIDGGATDVKFKQSYLNNFVRFSEKIENDLDLNNGGFFQEVHGYEPKKLAYDSLTALITEYIVSPETNPINSVNSIITDEVIFPREKFTYLSTHRQRDDYVNSFWRDSRQIRSDIGSQNFQPFISGNLNGDSGYTIAAAEWFGYTSGLAVSSSIWPLDARLDYDTAAPPRISEGCSWHDSCVGAGADPPIVDYGPFTGEALAVVSSSTDQAGLLQNAVVPYSQYIKYFDDGNTSDGNVWVCPALLPQYNRRIAGAVDTDLVHEYKFGDTKWEADTQSGINPFFDTYSLYVEDIKRMGKNYSIIPEFRISEHMDYYLNTKRGDFLADNPSFLSITGATPQNSSDDDFMMTYSHTDFLKAFNLVNNAYGQAGAGGLTPKIIELECEGLIKFLPYDGFYPADRTMQITKMFWESYSASFAITGAIIKFEDGALPGTEITPGLSIPVAQAALINPVWKSLFAPGILYNSIKSGMSVDYPVHTAGNDVTVAGAPNQRNAYGFLRDIPRIATNFDFRVPFESLVDPESYLQGVQIIDSEPHPSASANITASLMRSNKEDYKLAMHNFLASTIDFFKPNGELLTLAGKADNDPSFGSEFEVGKEYTMRIVCSNATLRSKQAIADYGSANGPDFLFQPSYVYNPQTLVMYAQTGTAADPDYVYTQFGGGDPYSISDYYGSAFGPPCKYNGTGVNNDPFALIAAPKTGWRYSSASYEPFTPPYYDGYSHIELTYRPQFDDDSMARIVQQLTQSYWRYGTGHPYTTGEVGIEDRMQLSASLNYLQLVSKIDPVLDQAGNVIQFNNDDSSKGTRLIIQPKWETPVLNFKDVDVTLPLIGSASVARGMWHQYGSLPASGEAINLQIQDLDPSEIDDPLMTGSLREALGFVGTQQAIGQIAEKKTISEAIIAVPIIITNPGNEGSSTKARFEFSRHVVNTAMRFVKDGRTEKYNQYIEKYPEREPTQEILDMIEKMQKYVIPPKFDFLTNRTIKPFAMFIFEFSVDLTQQDLANIWQNLTPEVGLTAKKAVASLPAHIFGLLPEVFEFAESTGQPLLTAIPENIQWQVFKIKQKAAWNYFDKTAQIEKDADDNINITGITKGTIPNYSYNWPYDFFSLVELGKINAKVTFTSPEDIQYIPPVIPGAIKPLPGNKTQQDIQNEQNKMRDIVGGVLVGAAGENINLGAATGGTTTDIPKTSTGKGKTKPSSTGGLPTQTGGYTGGHAEAAGVDTKKKDTKKKDTKKKTAASTTDDLGKKGTGTSFDF